MYGGDLVLAAILLTTPPGNPAPCPPEGQYAAVRDSVQHLAVEWEILDLRETRYVLARPEDFCSDLNMLRRRYQDLKDAPKVADSLRFPGRTEALSLVQFNRSYRKHLDERQQWEADRTEALRAVMSETDRLYKVWDAVRDARCEFYYVTVRRQALKKLRDLVGEEAYRAGTLPPTVPTWCFNELR